MVPEDLPIVGSAYRFSPADVPFRLRARLELSYPAGSHRPEKLGVYEQDDDSTWTFVDNQLDLDRNTVSAEVRHFSTYALLSDEVPPDVSELRPLPGSETADRRPIIEASVRDRGSGIGREKDISVRLNDRMMIFEYDPEQDVIRAKPREPLEPGVYRLEILVRDMCGNQQTQSGVFTVR